MIPVAEPWIGDKELEYVTEAVSTGWVSPRGEFVERFESAFASFVGVDHAFATSTGTAALHLSLVAAGISDGDEVIVPNLTWISCANVVEFVGATPVFADVDPETLTLDPDSVWDLLTERTAAIMPVHLYGHACDMGAIRDIAREHELFVVEDCAEAHGAEYDGERVGALGDVGCFSFYGNKLLTTGQGGMVTTNDSELAEKVRLYRRDGMSDEQKYYHPVIGYNYRLTNVQAGIGLGQLERVDEIVAEKRRVAATYREELSDTPVRVLGEPSWGYSVYWMNTVLFDTVAEKDAVTDALNDVDVETRPLFHPLDDQPPYQNAKSAETNMSEDVAARGLNLPSSPTLSESKIKRVCDTLKEAVSGN